MIVNEKRKEKNYDRLEKKNVWNYIIRYIYKKKNMNQLEVS